MGKFGSKSDEGVFLGYSIVGRAYRVYNLRTFTLVESVNVVVDDSTVDEKAHENIDIYDTWDIFENSSSSDNGDKTESPSIPLVPTPDIQSGGDSNNLEETHLEESGNDSELGSHDLTTNTREPSSRMKLYHPIDQVIEDPDEEVRTHRREGHNEVTYVCYTSTIEPKRWKKHY